MSADVILQIVCQSNICKQELLEKKLKKGKNGRPHFKQCFLLKKNQIVFFFFSFFRPNMPAMSITFQQKKIQ